MDGPTGRHRSGGQEKEGAPLAERNAVVLKTSRGTTCLNASSASFPERQIQSRRWEQTFRKRSARLVGLRDIQRASQQLPRKDKCNKWFHSDNDRERELRKEASRARILERRGEKEGKHSETIKETRERERERVMEEVAALKDMIAQTKKQKRDAEAMERNQKKREVEQKLVDAQVALQGNGAGRSQTKKKQKSRKRRKEKNSSCSGKPQRTMR